MNNHEHNPSEHSVHRLVRNFSSHELECCQHAAYACDHGESCWLPREDMEILQRAGLIEFVGPSDDDTPYEDYYYLMTLLGEEIARRINDGDIIPNAQGEPRLPGHQTPELTQDQPNEKDSNHQHIRPHLIRHGA
jgi:hypothetical protein